MSLLVLFHRAASEEFIGASTWYEGKRVGLGIEFIAEIERCISLASSEPLQFAVVRQDVRRVVANRFPYSVYFRTDGSRIVVLAVFMAIETRQSGRRESNAALGFASFEGWTRLRPAPQLHGCSTHCV